MPLKKLLRAGEGRPLKQFKAVVRQVNGWEASIQQMSDENLAGSTVRFKQRIDRGECLDAIMPEAFAVVREVARRTLGQRHYDVQVMGAAALHEGKIVEMKTGEGKTLASTMPAYLNALEGRGVHVVTVNDYLAARDAEWMGSVHRFLGIRVGLIQAPMSPDERLPAYQCDITYGTNNEFGFDYLRDNMARHPSKVVQRGHRYAIADEIDSILIDEARTPLIISGRVSGSANWYQDFAEIAEDLERGVHYEVDEKKRQILTTEEGVSEVEDHLGVDNLYESDSVEFIHHLDVALRAKELFRRNQEYLIDGGAVRIVDEFTGRVLPGRRYSGGIHQAIEAKEQLEVHDEHQTLATITLQNYFRMYEKLAGMTGTAVTEATEFAHIYGLDVLELPTNVPVARRDENDRVYKTAASKYRAVASAVAEARAKNQPVLLGTVSIENSEHLSKLLSENGIPHQVLNAKHHEREATIIAQAGRPGAVTVATNMAGRGVDIQLGGNAEALARLEFHQERSGGSPGGEDRLQELVSQWEDRLAGGREAALEAGGLLVLGTERHESRRIDNQLRGRAGRQGDPGRSLFYLSLEDPLVVRFQGERVAALMTRMKMPENVPIRHKMVSNALERAQGQVEAQNFEVRKNILQYDEVLNHQRGRVYEWRDGIMRGEGGDLVSRWAGEILEEAVRSRLEGLAPSGWDWEALNSDLSVHYPGGMQPECLTGDFTVERVVEVATGKAISAYRDRMAMLGAQAPDVERTLMLSAIDARWREHLAEMDYLLSGINLRSMGQRDPLVEYRRESYDLFTEMVQAIKSDTVRNLCHLKIKQGPPAISATPQ